MIRVLLIDNYDSFTYNIVHYFEMLGCQVDVVKNDSHILKQAINLHYSHVVLSPGPGTPLDSGYTFAVINEIYKEIPILGVCLGHQCLASFFGANIVHANNVMHGKISMISNDGSSIFMSLPATYKVVRYHSLIIDPESLPESLAVIAWTNTGIKDSSQEIMAIKHRNYNLFGVQFHPEAIMTEHGLELFRNFIELAK